MYLCLGEPVGQIHLEKEEKQIGFPSDLTVEGGFKRKQQLGRAARMGHYLQPIGLGCPKGCCDTLQEPRG